MLQLLPVCLFTQEIIMEIRPILKFEKKDCLTLPTPKETSAWYYVQETISFHFGKAIH